MGNSFESPGEYRIEISGWGLDDSFFVERTDLSWTSNGEKSVQLRRALAEGATVFVRLLAPESSNGTVPVPYRVEAIEPMDCNGRCRMTLKQLHPRSKESPAAKHASNEVEDSSRACDKCKTAETQHHEEILR